ncbi:MAG: hypothetical protein RML38_02925, partial [Bacteroidia bacterium]|nr:hypothetical protein [Bacteroidia bacterium]
MKYPTLSQWLIPEKDSTENHARKLALLQQGKEDKNQIISSKVLDENNAYQKQNSLVKDTNTYVRDTSEYAKRIALINPKDTLGNSAMDNFFKVLEQMEYTHSSI